MVICESCKPPREFKTPLALRNHQIFKHTEMLSRPPEDLKDTSQSDMNARLERIEDAIYTLSTGQAPVNSTHQTSLIPPQHFVRDEYSDLDRVVTLMTKFMLLKQFSSNQDRSIFSDMMNFQKFLDGREIDEPEQQEDPLIAVLTPLLSRVLGVDIPPQALNILNPKSNNMLNDQQIQTMSPDQIFEELRKDVNYPRLKQAVDQGLVDQKTAYTTLKKQFPSITHEKFNKVWGLVKNASSISGT